MLADLASVAVDCAVVQTPHVYGVAINANGKTTKFFYIGGSNLVAYETDGSGNLLQSYTYGANGEPLTLTTWSGGTGTTYYYHENGHGDVMQLTNSSGNTVARYTYDPWGNVTSESGSLDTTNPYLYAGYRWDSAIGMYYLNARYYAPNLMRFISADPSGGMNAYAYCDDNPVTKVDPSGDWSLWKTIATVAAVAVAVGLAATGVGLIADVAGLSLMEEAAAVAAEDAAAAEATVARRSRSTYRPRPRVTHHYSSARPRYRVNLQRFGRESGSTSKVIYKEVKSPNPVKPQDAVSKWNKFLGDGPHANVNPRTGASDPDRIFSSDGTKSIRFGNHEMNSRPTKFHYHEETWSYDPAGDVWNVLNTLVRVPMK